MIAGNRWMLILQGLGNTVLIALCAILIGTVLGCVFALFKISSSKILRGIANFYTTVIRGIPLATQLMIFYFVVFAPLGLDRLVVAILAYGINSGAYCTEIFRAGIQGVDIGQTEAGRSLGLTKSQTLVKIIERERNIKLKYKIRKKTDSNAVYPISISSCSQVMCGHCLRNLLIKEVCSTITIIWCKPLVV